MNDAEFDIVEIQPEDTFRRNSKNFINIAGFVVPVNAFVLFINSTTGTKRPVKLVNDPMFGLEGGKSVRTDQLLEEMSAKGFDRVRPFDWAYLCQNERDDRSEFAIYANASELPDGSIRVYGGSVFGTLCNAPKTISREDFEEYYTPFEAHPASLTRKE